MEQRERSSRKRKEMERRRKLRRKYARICQGLLASSAILLVAWFMVAVTLHVRNKNVDKQVTDMSAASERLGMYTEKNHDMEEQYRSLEAAVAEYERRKANPGIVDEVYAMAELIQKKERAATDRSQINESYAAAIEALKKQLQSMQ